MERVVAPLKSAWRCRAAAGLAALVALLAPVGCGGAASRAEVAASEQDWLGQAAAAELDGSWEIAALALDRWDRFHPGAADAAFLERRARLADLAGRPDDAAAARARLLALRPADDELRLALASDLQAAGDAGAALAVLAEGLAASRSPRLREARAAILGRSGQPLEAAAAYEELAAESADTTVRAALFQMAAALYEDGGDLPRAVAAIERALDPARLGVEEERLLSRLRAFQSGVPANARDAVDLMLHHPDPELRLAGARYLERDRFPGDEDAFERASGDPDPRLRQLATRELAARAGAAAAGRLEQLAADPDPSVRIAAVRGLGLAGGLAQVPVLLAALDPEDRASFRAARLALESITGEVIGLDFDPELARRIEIAAAWQAWWDAHDAPPAGAEGGR